MKLPLVSNIVGRSVIKHDHLGKQINVIKHLNNGDIFNSLMLGHWFQFLSKHSDILLIIFIILLSLLCLTVQFLLIKWYLAIEQNKCSCDQGSINNRFLSIAQKKCSCDQGSINNRFHIDDDDLQSVQSSTLSSAIIQC
jgi:hypothetical protein